MKSLARQIITKILWGQVAALRKKNKLTVIGVAGSIGKTSTKFAIAELLEGSYKVQWQQGNYNHISIVPLVFFGQNIPSLFNPLAWLRVILDNQSQINNYPYDVVVLELGTDGPGQLLEFKQYLHLDVAVVTAVVPEHMEFFNTIEAVAEEELSISEFSDTLIVNTDLVDKAYLTKKLKYVSYGTKHADYQFITEPKFVVKKKGKAWLQAGQVTTHAQAYSKAAATVVADLQKVSAKDIEARLGSLQPVPGRLQILEGVNGAIIIDDTYNASPDATVAALHTLYQHKAGHKIALLGNMNELGDYSEEAHKKIGVLCDPKQLELVVTVGPDANQFLAPAAEAKGCNVKKFSNPYDAGRYVKDHIKKNTVILAKGSQNNVYMEEAVKVLLANPKDSEKLVRQSSDWHKKKLKNFNDKQA